VSSYAIDVTTSRTPEEGAHSPSWPNGLVIIIIYHISLWYNFHIKKIHGAEKHPPLSNGRSTLGQPGDISANKGSIDNPRLKE
jgi:hypothetical protein